MAFSYLYSDGEAPANLDRYSGREHHYEAFPNTTSATTAFWRWARAMAYLGKNNLAAAKDERYKFLLEVIETPSALNWGNNLALDILQIAALELDAKIAYVGGKTDEAIQLLKVAVEKQDNLVYDEPIPWPPVREALGAAYYANRQYSEAEQVFRKDLGQTAGVIYRTANPNNGRSLFGLYNTLKAQGSPYQEVQTQFNRAWKDADVELAMSDLF